MLDITQQIHEVKKDSQRILAGLVKLADREVTGDLPLSVIMKFTMKSNAKYAEMLGKHIQFTLNMTSDYITASYTPLLTLLGNLTANAVEVIKGNGSITLDVREGGEYTVFSVADSGGGIKERDRELLFEPGFTTKFNQEGVAATGIGLSHVQDIVDLFAGQITVEPVSELGGARFQIKLPVSGLRKEE
ncbi:Sensor histidine kinase GlnK [compost metagenome]